MIYIKVQTETNSFYYTSNFDEYIKPQQRYALSLDITDIQKDFIGDITNHITFSTEIPFNISFKLRKQ